MNSWHQKYLNKNNCLAEITERIEAFDTELADHQMRPSKPEIPRR